VPLKLYTRDWDLPYMSRKDKEGSKSLNAGEWKREFPIGSYQCGGSYTTLTKFYSSNNPPTREYKHDPG